MHERFVFIHEEGFAVGKPIHEELEQSVKDIEQEARESTRTDEALRESESRYRRFFEAAQDGIPILDADAGQFWLPVLFEIEESAAKKPKIEPNRATGTIPMIENDEVVMGKYQFGS